MKRDLLRPAHVGPPVAVLGVVDAETLLTVLSIDACMKNNWPMTCMPVANIWSAHAMNDRIRRHGIVHRVVHPKSGLRDNAGMTCEMIPNAGRIMMYTSGCPKNQRICWYITGSPPPLALKRDVPKWQSNSSIVMAPSSTGITADFGDSF
ncbi:hypothetical protein PTKU46_79920 [Paraburkholderia terrae]